MLNIAIIGYGYWGPNLTRNFHEQPNSRVKYVVDASQQRLDLVEQRYPEVQTCKSITDILGDPELDAVAIATPVSAHFELAQQALKAGKHVLVEKPLTNSSADCQTLMDLALSNDLVLMVDHPFLYSGPVRKIKELIDTGDIGEIFYFDSTRINLGLFNHDVSVLWDLAVHDLSIIDYLSEIKPVSVSATGISHFPGQPENISYINLFYDNNCISHIHVNWMAPVKLRQSLICGSKKMVVYDDLNPDEKIKIYDKGVSIEQDSNNIEKMLVGYRNGDIFTPRIDPSEPLRTMTGHFIECIKESKQPLSDAGSALRIIKILEAAEYSMKNQGQMVELN